MQIDQYLVFQFNFVCVVICNYQPDLILTLDPPKSSRASHDTGNVRPVDRMCEQSAARTPTGDMNERAQRVRLSQRLNELRLDVVTCKMSISHGKYNPTGRKGAEHRR